MLANDIPLGTLIENKFGDQYLFAINRNSFEQLDYQTQFNKEFSQTFGSEDTLYVITGTDSGLLVKQLLKSPPQKGSAYVFIDFPEVIELTSSQYDLAKHKRIIVSSEEQWQEKAKHIGLDVYFMINKVKQVKSFGAQYNFFSNYLYLEQSLNETINHLTWLYQSQLGSKTFTQRQLENLAENRLPAIQLKDRFKGKSALILAGGPSLDNYIHWIEENQQHYLVIAVTRIARRLMQTKIKPDIFVSVDPHVSNFNVSKEVFNFEKDSLLVHQYHINPVILGNWLGKNLYLGELFPWKSPLNKSNLTGIGPTVTNTAIQLAINMGIKQQIMFGIDLCYSPEGYTHAKNSIEHDSGPNINSIGQIVITNNGDKAETNSAYFEASEIIEQLAEITKLNGGQLINPSPTSVRMRHVEHTLIDKIKPDQDIIDISSFLNNKLTDREEQSQKIKHYQAVLKELKEARYKVDKIEVFAKKGLEFNKKLFAGNKPEDNFNYKIKMDKLEKDLHASDIKELTELSKKFGVKEFLYFINPDSEREWSNEDIKKSADTYYKALKTGAEELNRHIFTAINRTEIRLLENNRLNIDPELIQRHLISFDKSYLLDRQIRDQEDHISRNNNKFDQKQKQHQLTILKELQNNKEVTVQKNKQLYSSFLNRNNHLPGADETDKLKALSFYLVMLQNEENHQTRRLYYLKKENAGLCQLPDSVSLLNSSPYAYLRRHEKINRSFTSSVNLEKLIIQNQIVNCADNYLSAELLKDHYKNKNAIILTDSQSLLDYQDWIETHQENFIIIALSHLAKDLSVSSINPDFLIATSPFEDKFEVNKDIISFEENSILINAVHFIPKLLGNWLGISFYLGDSLPWDKKQNDIDKELEHFCQEELSAIYFASLIGLHKQIIFFDRNKFQYRSKKLKALIKKMELELYSPVDFTADSKNLNKIDINEINIPVDSCSVSEMIAEQKISQISKQTRHCKNLIGELNTLSQQLSDNKNTKLNHLLQIYTNDKSAYYENKEEDEFKELLRSIDTAVLISESRLLASEALDIDEAMVIRHLSNNNNILIDNLSKTHPVIRNRELIKSEYLSDPVNRQAVTQFFMIMNLNGLAQHYRRIIPLLKLLPAYLNNLEKPVINNKKIQDMIDAHLYAYETLFSINQNNTQMKFKGLAVKLYNAFMLKDLNTLKKIRHGINLIKENSQIKSAYEHLSNGYIYDLENKTELAINEYGQADIDETRESALKRIAFITLNEGQIEHAYTALKILSEISPFYLPQLAELFTITKNYKDALDIYSHYIDYNPSDVSVLLKIAQLYEMQDILEGALFVYKQIINLEPDNKIATQKLKLLQH
jgi:hypothetical protein